MLGVSFLLNKNNTQTLSIRLERSLHEELKTVAFFNKTTMNEIINELVKKYLADVKKDKEMKK
jgi:predicted DNA-binding protein